MESIAFSRTWKNVPSCLQNVLFKRIESIIKKPLTLENPLNQIRFTTNQTIKYNLEPLFTYFMNFRDQHQFGSSFYSDATKKNDLFLDYLCTEFVNQYCNIFPININNIKTFIELKKEDLARRGIENSLSEICNIKYNSNLDQIIDNAESQSKYLDLVRFFIEECHVSVHTPSYTEHTLLLQAISSKNIHLIEFLLKKEANPNQKAISSEPLSDNPLPFHRSRIPLFRTDVFSSINPSARSLDIFYLLLRYGADINIADNQGNTCLMLAVCKGNLPLIKDILNHSGINPLQQNAKGETARSIVKSRIDSQTNLPANNLLNNNIEPSLETYQTILSLLDDAIEQTKVLA